MKKMNSVVETMLLIASSVMFVAGLVWMAVDFNGPSSSLDGLVLMTVGLVVWAFTSVGTAHRRIDELQERVSTLEQKLGIQEKSDTATK